MKKVLAMVGVMLFSASAFALNVEVQGDGKCPGKAEFEHKVKTQEDALVITSVMLDFSDPLESMTDEQAQPLAECYADYRVYGKSLPEYVRMHAVAFEKKGATKEAARMRNFAGRVEALSEKVSFDEMAKQDSDYFIAQNILTNYAARLAKLTDAEAAPKAKVYARFEVKGEPMLQFVSRLASQHDELEGLHDFAHRVSALAK